MNPFPSHGKERGAVLVIGLIVLMIITLMVTAAFKFSTSNLKSVGNMQTRNEAIAAANKAIEQVVGSWTFNTAPTIDHIEVDIDNDGVNDYVVDVAVPVCVRATGNRGVPDKGSECTMESNGKTICPSTTAEISGFSATWELDATATDTNSGTTVRVRQGISRELNQSQCNMLCPPAPGVECT